MKTLCTADFQEINRWVYRNARPVDLARYRFHFEEGCADAVLSALSAYQNKDGGFGHALEADNWNPGSSPLTTSTAIDLLGEIAFSDSGHPIVKGILAYLDSGADFHGGFWPFTIPANDAFPHAPWWTYGEKANDEAGFNPSAILAGFILRFADSASKLYDTALSMTETMFGKIRNSCHVEVHELNCYCRLLQNLRQANLTGRFDCEFLAARLKNLVHAAIERDPENWPTYSMRPSMYISSPDSIFCKGNEDIVEKELDYILSSRKESGVWDISWRWGNYPDEFAISANWWKAHWAIGNLLMLRAFGRIEA